MNEQVRSGISKLCVAAIAGIGALVMSLIDNDGIQQNAPYAVLLAVVAAVAGLVSIARGVTQDSSSSSSET